MLCSSASFLRAEVEGDDGDERNRATDKMDIVIPLDLELYHLRSWIRPGITWKIGQDGRLTIGAVSSINQLDWAITNMQQDEASASKNTIHPTNSDIARSRAFGNIIEMGFAD